MTTTKRPASPPVPARCDRCGHNWQGDHLTHDGLGLVCPPCRIDGATARDEEVG